jgi:outer membrane protein
VIKLINKVILLVFLSTLVSEVKIGYLNADKILTELDEVRQVQIQLEKEQRKIESNYMNLEMELDSLLRSYEQQKMLMSEERRRKLEKTLTDKQAELQRFQMEKVGPQGEIYKIHDQLMAPVYAKIDEAIQKVGKQEGYDYIFNVVSGGIVYALPQYDLTDLVVKELEKISEINE